MTEEDALLRRIAEAFDLKGPRHAADNLLGAKIDLEREEDADPVCIGTITRVWKQLLIIEKILKEGGYSE